MNNAANVIENFNKLTGEAQAKLIQDFLATLEGLQFAAKVWNDKSVAVETKIAIRYFADSEFRIGLANQVFEGLKNRNG